VELSALRWMRMFGTASAAKASFVDALGATAIDFHAEDVARRVREQAPAGIDAIFDALGGWSWKKDLPLLRPGGQLVIYGVTKGFKNGGRNCRDSWAHQGRATSATSPKAWGSPAGRA
jgi:NADPH:quinone reductase-like Zn-dependent oxidoreductase